MGLFANGMQEFIFYLHRLKNLEKIYITGGVLDICVLELALSLKKLFNQMNRNIEVIIPKNGVTSYDAPWHNREEYSQWAFKLLIQGGVKNIRKKEENS